MGVADLEDCEVAEFLRFSELVVFEEDEEEEDFLDFFSESERLLCLLLCDLSLLLLFLDAEELEAVAALELELLALPLDSTSSSELFGVCFCTCVAVAVEELLPLEDALPPLLLLLPVVPTFVLPGTEADFCSTDRASVVAAGTLRLLLSC